MPCVNSAANGSLQVRAAAVAGLAHRPVEEARVEQVQDRVLDAADVLVDRHPVVERGLVGRRLGVGRREAREIPRANRRTCPSCRSRAGPPCRTSGNRHASTSDAGRADCRACRSVTSSGSLTGRSGRRHRHDAARLAVDDRDRAAPVALARDAPVAQAVVDLALGRPACRRASRLRAAWRPRRTRPWCQTVEELRVDHHAVVDDRRRRRAISATRLRARFGSALGATTGMTGRPYLRANSMSRWSCAGQPKMAPVP